MGSGGGGGQPSYALQGWIWIWAPLGSSPTVPAARPRPMSSGPPPGPGAAASSALQPSWLAVSSVLPDRLQPLPRRRRGCEPRPQRRRWRAACGRQVSRRPGPRPVPWESCLTLAPRTRRGAGSAWNVPVLTAEGRAGRGAGVWQTQPDISGQKQGEISVLGACPQGPGQTLLLQREGFWRTGPASPAGGEAPRGPGARRLSCPFLVSRALLDTTPWLPRLSNCLPFSLDHASWGRRPGPGRRSPSPPGARPAAYWACAGAGPRGQASSRGAQGQRGGLRCHHGAGRFASAAQPWGHRSRSSPPDRPRPPMIPFCLETPICPPAPAACCW